MAFIAEAGRRIGVEAASNLSPERVWLEFHLGGMNVVQVAVLKTDLQEAIGRWLAQDTAARLDAKPLSLVRKDGSHA